MVGEGVAYELEEPELRAEIFASTSLLGRKDPLLLSVGWYLRAGDGGGWCSRGAVTPRFYFSYPSGGETSSN